MMFTRWEDLPKHPKDMSTLEYAQYFLDEFVRDGSKVINVCTYPDRIEADILTTKRNIKGLMGLPAFVLRGKQFPDSTPESLPLSEL